jgi:hypothetical protein
MASYEGVIAEAFRILKDEWDVGSLAVVSPSTDIPPILKEDTERSDIAGNGGSPVISTPGGGTRRIDADEPFARYSMKHVSGNKASVGGRLFRRDATISVQVFYPARGGVGKAKAIALAKVAQGAYESASTSVANFVSVSLREVGRSGPWYQVNVTANVFWFERK